jgi:hypothetical protein
LNYRDIPEELDYFYLKMEKIPYFLKNVPNRIIVFDTFSFFLYTYKELGHLIDDNEEYSNAKSYVKLTIKEDETFMNLAEDEMEKD